MFETNKGFVNAIIIENQQLFYRILCDMQNQIEGNEGKTIISKNDKVLPFGKNVEVLSQFIPFDLSKKQLINKVISDLEKRAIQESYAATMEMLAKLNSFLFELSFDLPGDIDFSKVEIGSILKAVGIHFSEDYCSLGEKIIDYMELVSEYDQKKLFILVNLRSYISDAETQIFMETVIQREYHVVMIDNHGYTILKGEERYLIDSDCCEIV